MNKKIIISIIFFIIVIILIVLLYKDQPKVLVCNGDVVLVGGRSDIEHTFEGINDIVKKEKLEVRMFIDDINSIDDYIEIIKDNEDCYDMLVEDNFISYTCDYDLEEVHFYDDLEDSNHRLSFKVIKQKFEEDNFVCVYK